MDLHWQFWTHQRSNCFQLSLGLWSFQLNDFKWKLSFFRAMALCLSLMSGRLGAVMGSNVIGFLLDDFCEYTFLMPTILLILSACLAFTIPNISKRTKWRNLNKIDNKYFWELLRSRNLLSSQNLLKPCGRRNIFDGSYQWNFESFKIMKKVLLLFIFAIVCSRTFSQIPSDEGLPLKR